MRPPLFSPKLLQKRNQPKADRPLAEKAISMRKKKIHNNGKTLRMGFVFLGLVFFLLVGSFVSKIVTVAKQSLFDGEHRFTVLLQNNTLVSFAPDLKSISLLEVEGINIADSQKISVILGVPVDGFVTFSSLIREDKSRVSNQYILSLLKQGVLQQGISQTNLTLFDFLRLWFFTKSIPNYEVTYATYRIASPTEALSDLVLDKLVSSLFVDDALSSEKVSINIVNASGVTGLGNRIARILTNSGGNVIAVSTANDIIPKSEVRFIEKDSYTLERIVKLLSCKVSPVENNAISDIVVTIGKYRAAQFSL